MLVFSIWNTIMVLETRTVSRATPLNDRNCHLTMPGKGRCSEDAPSHTFNIDVIKTIKINSTTLKNTYS